MRNTYTAKNIITRDLKKTITRVRKFIFLWLLVACVLGYLVPHEFPYQMDCTFGTVSSPGFKTVISSAEHSTKSFFQIATKIQGSICLLRSKPKLKNRYIFEVVSYWPLKNNQKYNSRNLQ